MRKNLRCLAPVESASAQVEEGRLIQLANRRTVTAFDVISINFELRFGVDLGFVRQQQVVIRLPGISTIRAPVNDRLAVPDTTAAAIENASIFLRG